jgi:hypothetical protein
MRTYLQPLGLGLLGMALALVLWHLWQDHEFLHALAAQIQQAQAAQHK